MAIGSMNSYSQEEQYKTWEKKSNINLSTGVAYTVLAFSDLIVANSAWGNVSKEQVYLFAATLMLGLVSAVRGKFFEYKITDQRKLERERRFGDFVKRQIYGPTQSDTPGVE